MINSEPVGRQYTLPAKNPCINYMIKGGVGGANTQTGIKFEKRVDILTLLAEQKGYSIKGKSVYFDGKEVAKSYQKGALYKYLSEQGVDYKALLSKKLLPDEAILVDANRTLFIIEMKFQVIAGSVDEKLQTCDFKRKQYTKLLAPLAINVEYIYLLSDWFEKPEYEDVLAYIHSVGCHYYFNSLSLETLGLPVSKN